MDLTKAIKGHINGRAVPTNTSRLHNITGLLANCSELLHDILVSWSSTKRLFTPPKKMMDHQKALPDTDGCPFAIKRADLPSNWPPTVILVFYFRFFGYVFYSFMFAFLVFYFRFLWGLFWLYIFAFFGCFCTLFFTLFLPSYFRLFCIFFYTVMFLCFSLPFSLFLYVFSLLFLLFLDVFGSFIYCFISAFFVCFYSSVFAFLGCFLLF